MAEYAVYICWQSDFPSNYFATCGNNKFRHPESREHIPTQGCHVAPNSRLISSRFFPFDMGLLQKLWNNIKTFFYPWTTMHGNCFVYVAPLSSALFYLISHKMMEIKMQWKDCISIENFFQPITFHFSCSSRFLSKMFLLALYVAIR